MEEGIGNIQDCYSTLLLVVYYSCHEDTIRGNYRQRAVGPVLAVVSTLLTAICSLLRFDVSISLLDDKHKQRYGLFAVLKH